MTRPTPIRRATMLGLALVFALSACAGGSTIGGDLTDPGTSISASPTQSVKPPSKKPGKKKPNVQKSEEPKVDINTIIIAVRDNFTGFEWKAPGDKKWNDAAAAGGPGAFVGDIIIFKNLDKAGQEQGFEHSWVNEKGGGVGAGKLFNSGVLSYGESYEWKVPNKPGQYRYKDGEVPYRASVGPLVIFER